MSKVIEINSPEEMLSLGRDIGAKAVPGEIWALNGDLGTGKTVFAKGVAAGLNIEEDISSPTFTIVKEYHSGRLPLFHFDVYRIGDIDEMDEIGYEDYIFGDGISLIEWADIIEDLLPEDINRILIEKDPEKGFDYRRVIIDECDRD